ncbi:MAG: hypothetical protein HYU37_19490 [Acidobacteria bacterium]|nr:hypothetical protein [Acidobacteriota bacterium]
METYFRLAPRDSTAPTNGQWVKATQLARSYAPRAAQAVLATPGKDVWADRLRKFQERKAAAQATTEQPPVTPAPVVCRQVSWRSLGPRLVLDGQTVGRQPVAGRVTGIAIDRTGRIVYAATACGGVFRSNDGGTHWQSPMDQNPSLNVHGQHESVDIQAREFASSSLACGAIAIDPADPNRVYVGTGEGDTHKLFPKRIVDALPTFRGIGPIRSDDGGVTWVTEPTASDSPDLAGDAFFALAVDPHNRENVLAATILGLYQRVPKEGGGFQWVRRRPGVYSSVVVVSSGTTRRFFAARWGKGVFQSDDGRQWKRKVVGEGFPTADVGRIALGTQPANLDLLYAFVATKKGRVKGVYRLSSGVWKRLRKVPKVLPGSQGDYDLAIAVDPEDVNLIYLGGDRIDADPFSGSIWRCVVRQDGATFRVTRPKSIGRHAHSDIHVLAHTPGEPYALWCASDGGLFLNRNPRGNGRFESRNDGLSCLCCNFITQHPTDPNILFTGLQDNGTARTPQGPEWACVQGGDGGYCVVNWADPKLVLVFANGKVYRSTRGGSTQRSWSTIWKFDWVTMTQPIVSAPFNPASLGDADVVAVGAGDIVFVSTDFAASWPTQFTLPRRTGNVFALAFASSSRLFIGTTTGAVFRADWSGNKAKWSVMRLDEDVDGARLGLEGLITDIAVDWSDPDRESVYVAFGGMGDSRRVWRFDGTGWEARSGDPENQLLHLLDVEHNALVVDPQGPDNLYVGADIGVWHSPDAGRNWYVMQRGLPDAAVFDLQLHPTQRLLRAALHGRGVYEIALP